MRSCQFCSLFSPPGSYSHSNQDLQEVELIRKKGRNQLVDPKETTLISAVGYPKSTVTPVGTFLTTSATRR